MTCRSQQDCRTWAEVDLDAIVFNYKQAVKQAARAQDRPLYCMLKADAYGHGAVQVARALAGAGAGHFAVFTPEEALQLRGQGVTGDILLMGAAYGGMIDTLAQNGVLLTVSSRHAAQAYAAALKRRARICVELDTGMVRTGAPVRRESRVDEAAAWVAELAAMPCFEFEGIFTHYAVADDPLEKEFTDAQESLFNQVCAALASRGLDSKKRHCSNSAALASRVDRLANMARPGLMLYGYNTADGTGPALRPALSWRARVIQVQHIEKGDSVGYGRSWRAPGDAVIATISAGYADGLHRRVSGKIAMLVRGREAPQVGRVCMDMCMLDVTGIDGVTAGDTATIIGADGGRRVTAFDLAAAAGTIPYEILCAVGPRVPRIYFQNGAKITSVLP